MSENSSNKKTIMITGANSGIGKAAASQLAQLEVRVILVSRNLSKGKAALEEISEKSHNKDIHLFTCDLSSQSSIRNMVKEYCNKFDRLDVLINNAATFDLAVRERKFTEDNIELFFATNHLGPFLLTNLMLKTLRRSKPGRVINISSKGLLAHPFLRIEFDNLRGNNRGRFSPERAYYTAKLAQEIFTYSLADREDAESITSNCVRVPSVRVSDERILHLPKISQRMYRLKSKKAISPEEMAGTYVFLSTDGKICSITGRMFDEKKRIVKSSKYTCDKEVWKRLWESSAELVGL